MRNSGRKNRSKNFILAFSILWLLAAPPASVCAAELPADIKNILLKITSSIVDKDFGGFQDARSESNSLPGDAKSRLSPLAVSPLQLYFPLNNGDSKDYEVVISGTTYYATYSYSPILYNGRMCYLERDSSDGSQVYFGYSEGQLQMYGASVGTQMIAFDTPLNILNDSMLNNGGFLQSSTTLTVQGYPVTVNVTVISTLAGSVTTPLGTADNCRSIDMTLSYSVPGESGSVDVKEAWILAPYIGKLRIAAMDQNMTWRGWFTISGGTIGGKSVGEILSPRIPLSTSKAGSGSGTISSTPVGINCGSSCLSSYASGTNVTLTATPGSDSTFAGWSGGGCSGTGQCIVKLDTSKTVTATFSLKTYAITLPTVTNGIISCNPITVNHGSNTSCSITPSTGYHVVSLTDNGANATSAMVGNTYAINNVVSSHTLSPTFAINTYTITTSAGANGSIAPSSTVNHGSGATVAITPIANYHVADVLVDGVSVGAVTSYSFQNVTAGHTISATFAINTYTLAITKAGTGSGTVTSVPNGLNCGNTCSASYVGGTTVTLTATPTLGSTFTGWSGGGCTGIGNCSLLINNNTPITALFSNPWGDVNNDKKIDLTDAILSLQVLSNMDTTGKTITIAADANNDSKIGLAEVIYILQKVGGMR
jgi:hypothetical protein